MRVRHQLIEGQFIDVGLETRTVTMAVIRHNGKIVATGDAFLKPGETYNENLGYKIALGRALTNAGVGQHAKKKILAGVMGKVELKQARAIYNRVVRSLGKEVTDKVDEILNDYFLFGGIPRLEERTEPYLGKSFAEELSKADQYLTGQYTPVSYDTETGTLRPMIDKWAIDPLYREPHTR